ncbi:MAG: circularly permuted type 2 ATP-grasp protein [Negativicutes bacterium]|jgi:uncharacterized circularly permuted ATP-grasp superfamily protein
MFEKYQPTPKVYDEMFNKDGSVRPHYTELYKTFDKLDMKNLAARQNRMDDEMIKQGITFTLYNEDSNALERTIPFDIIPRIISHDDWTYMQRGLKQRVIALNRFIHDIYHEQRICRDGVVPRKQIVTNKYFRPEMMHQNVPGDVYICWSGIDLIRAGDSDYYVLEDNLRTPSGVSYLYKNRWMMEKLFPELFFNYHVMNLDRGLHLFLRALRSIAPNNNSDPTVVLLTPGRFNSAYFEHTFLAQEMGLILAEGQDLKVVNNKVYLKTLHGLRQVDVIYRRIDDDFIDPLAFRPDSMLGVPGLMNAYRAGNVALANAPGTGFADDKAVYTYVPDIIRYYLNEEPILKNVPTYTCALEDDRKFVLDNIEKMVVKETSLSGGYGMLIGPHATKEEHEQFRRQICERPDDYIAQPTIQLSAVPTLCDGVIAPRRVDLRPYIALAANEEINIIPGGLTRVAMREGSLVVNSSQGGGSKDTWVIEE